MNPYQFEVTCDICGGKGVGTSRTSAAAWIKGSVITHKDPTICIENLRRKREQNETRNLDNR